MGRERLWNQVFDEFRGMRMDEEVVKLLEMDIRSVTAFGPVDVSLMKLAQRYEALSPLVLTIDDPLQRACEKAAVRVRHLREINWLA